MQILVFGNQLVKKDSLPIKLIPPLKKLFPLIEFIELDGIENLEKYGRRLYILDTVEGIKEPCIIHISDIRKQKVLSMHDCDLGFNLLLLKKIGKIDDAVIVGIPMKITRKAALEKVKSLIESIKSQ
ncbi:MAG: hypothetical protein WC852_06725 [Candidatus Nanoarchaeia archaeon]|jgi:hypothetical protein